MMNKRDSSADIEDFVHEARRRINRRRLLRSASLGALLCAIAMAGIAIGFVSCGYKVQTAWFVAAAGAGGILLAVYYLLRRTSPDWAARQADSQFGLKDGLVSAVGFRRQDHHEGFYALQAEHTRQQVAKADLREIRLRPPWLILCGVVTLVLLSAWLSTFADSPRVQDRKQAEAMTEAQTAEVKELLEEEIEELNKDLDDDEKELLDKSGIAQMVHELKATKDHKEALRQYAKIERKLREVSAKLQVQRDEKFLSEAAKELNKAKETRSLGKRLESKQYSQAAKDIKKLKSSDSGSLTERRKQADRLKSVARRMKDAANRMSASSSQFKSLSENLSQSSQQMQESFDEAEEQECKSGSCSKATMDKLNKDSKSCSASVSKVAMALRKLNAKKKFGKKMYMLKKSLGQCQSYVAGQCKSPLAGKKAGMATDGRMSDRDPTEDSRGLDTQLTGQKGAGPSQIAVEEAASGSGVSRLKAGSRQAIFRRQVESLVRREEIPENLKTGVKTYFESIQEASQPQEQP